MQFQQCSVLKSTLHCYCRMHSTLYVRKVGVFVFSAEQCVPHESEAKSAVVISVAGDLNVSFLIPRVGKFVRDSYRFKRIIAKLFVDSDLMKNYVCGVAETSINHTHSPLCTKAGFWMKNSEQRIVSAALAHDRKRCICDDLRRSEQNIHGWWWSHQFILM